MLWRSLWSKDEPALNQATIQDCLSLDHMHKIPWLSHVGKQLELMGSADSFLTCNLLQLSRKTQLNQDLSTVLREHRERMELGKKRVVEYFPVVTTEHLESYLLFPCCHSKRIFLIRFRFSIAHFFVSYPSKVYSDSLLDPCPCDSKSPQNMLHFLFLSVIL